MVGLTFQARPFYGLRVAGAADNHFLAANNNHDVADPGSRITSDGNLRRSELLGHDGAAKKNVYEKVVPPGISGNRRPLLRQPGVPGRTLGGTTASQRTQVPGVAAHAVQRENLMRATHAQCQLSQDLFPALAGSGSLPGKHAPVGLNKSPDARDQSQSAANRHRSERAHPRLPWHSRCLLAGIGRGTECCAWLDAPRFAAKPQVQGRLASGEEFGPSCKYAPTAARFKPRRTQTHFTSKIRDAADRK